MSWTSIEEINKRHAEHQSKKIGETHLNAKIQMLEDLIKEINDEGYETFNQLKGSIESNLDTLNKVKAKDDKEMTSEQYEAEAKADHFSGEQFNGL